jgi:hypothetical protein
MLYRHIQQVFLQADRVDTPVTGAVHALRPLDSDAPDYLMRFLFWAALDAVAPAPPPAPAPTQPGTPPRVPQVPAPLAKLLIEHSADGEGWTTLSTLDPRERPYLVTVGQMLPFLRVRLMTRAMPAKAMVQLLSNAPFTLDTKGGSP